MQMPSAKTRSISPLGSFLCIVTMIGFLFIIYATGRHVGVDVGRSELTIRENYQKEKANALRECSKIVGPDALNCTKNALESAQQNSETRQSLYAQQDAARWGFYSIIVGICSTLITGFGTVLIFHQVSMTRKALMDTENTTQAMILQNEFYFEKERAQLQVKSCIYKGFNENYDPPSEFILRIVNEGSSPAKIVAFLFKWIDNREYPNIQLAISDYPIALVGGNIEIDLALGGPLRNDTRLEYDGKAWIFGVIRYHTLGRGPFLTHFGFEVTEDLSKPVPDNMVFKKDPSIYLPPNT